MINCIVMQDENVKSIKTKEEHLCRYGDLPQRREKAERSKLKNGRGENPSKKKMKLNVLFCCLK